MLRVLSLGLVVALLGGECRGEIFDLGDVDDQLAQIWQNTKQQTNKFIGRQSTECKAETKSGVKYGECMPHSKCLVSGGDMNGFCGLFSTCCIIENSCAKSSDAKVGYFEANDLSNGITSCNYNIKLRNKNVCQIRLDFIKFNLAPSILQTPQYSQHQVYQCVDDKLKIIPNHYGIPDLCGNNDKQHVYIHINQTDGVTKGVQLQMLLADRNYNPHLYAPSWKIKVTQLECPNQYQGFIIPSNDINDDFPMLAPLGSIQHFTDRTGYFKSFGYDGSNIKQSYPYGNKYSITFKREIGVCGIRFIPDYVHIPNVYQSSEPVPTDTNCFHYLFVPELYFDDQGHQTIIAKVCLKNDNAVFNSYAPGPLYVYFNTMNMAFDTDANAQQGFNIKYEVLTRCP